MDGTKSLRPTHFRFFLLNITENSPFTFTSTDFQFWFAEAAWQDWQSWKSIWLMCPSSIFQQNISNSSLEVTTCLNSKLTLLCPRRMLCSWEGRGDVKGGWREGSVIKRLFRSSVSSVSHTHISAPVPGGPACSSDFCRHPSHMCSGASTVGYTFNPST